MAKLPGSRAQAQYLWHRSRAALCSGLSGSVVEPVSPGLSGRFSTTEPPGKSLKTFLMLMKKGEEVT